MEETAIAKTKPIKDMSPEELKLIEVFYGHFDKSDYDYNLLKHTQEIVSRFYGEKEANSLFVKFNYENLDIYWSYYAKYKREGGNCGNLFRVLGGFQGLLMRLRSDYYDIKHEQNLKAEIKKELKQEIYSELNEKFKKAGINIEL